MTRLGKITICTLTLSFVLLAGCSEADLNSLRLTIKEDGSGTLVMVQTSSFDNAATTVTRGIRGMDWEDKGISITCRTATFKKIEDLDILGITVVVRDNRMRMTVPIGQTAAWPNVLLPDQTDVAAIRKRARKEGLPISLEAGTSWKFVVRLPGTVIAQGAVPKIASSGSFLSMGGGKSNEAELVLPLKKVLNSQHDELIWEVTWK